MSDESLVDSSLDITKLKVQDLKKELKLRGLSTSGNKTELLERLQAAMKSPDVVGTESVDDLEEDLLNGDDDEHIEASDSVILENEFDSPKILKRKLESADTSKGNRCDSSAPLPRKKVILNRNSSYEPDELTAPIKDENTVSDTTEKSADKEDKKVVKLSQLTAKERLEMRAKKFGVNTISDEAKKLVRAERFGTTTNSSTSSISISSNKVSTNVDVLKQRAERFGGSVSSVMSGLENQEKLEKRKARFGLANGTSSQNDKGKLRLTVN